MRKLILTPHFKRAFRRYVRHSPLLQERIEQTLRDMEQDVLAAHLAQHPLTGKLQGIRACSCGYDCRILFTLELHPLTGEELIVLLNIGTHDDVY
ncbi:MAG: type II toxin-antitoxin system mRNA interferase toxin, RelE/StbE family [Methylococcaceae bacterium]|nr:type II toxin-antitoxin system mRNA interferase toxin, RelE/StbE family [Methylococcaceae bacterium]